MALVINTTSLESSLGSQRNDSVKNIFYIIIFIGIQGTLSVPGAAANIINIIVFIKQVRSFWLNCT